jgi:hypothetical protein
LFFFSFSYFVYFLYSFFPIDPMVRQKQRDHEKARWSLRELSHEPTPDLRSKVHGGQGRQWQRDYADSRERDVTYYEIAPPSRRNAFERYLARKYPSDALRVAKLPIGQCKPRKQHFYTVETMQRAIETFPGFHPVHHSAIKFAYL